jgi:hypothetical protein
MRLNSATRRDSTVGIAVIALLSLLASLCAAEPTNLVPNGSFEGGPTALAGTGWQLHDGVAVEKGTAEDGDWYVRIKPDADAAKPSSLKLTGVPVKPNTGYIARYRMRGDGAAHHTFGVLNPNGTFFVCRDAYAAGGWSECTLSFRTAEQTEISLYLGRRYGTGAILYDDVRLVEDDTVRVGDLSPAPNPLPPVEDAETRRGYLLSAQHWMDLVYPTYLPTRSELITSLHCRLAPGEYEPVALSVTALRPLASLQVSLVGDLEAPGTGTLPAAAVRIGVVRTMTRWFNNGAPLKPGQSYERRPMFIFPQAPVDVPERETQRFWLTVHAPVDLPPGQYSSSLKVSAEGAEPTQLPLTVEVLPLQLPEPEVTYGMYYRQHEQYAEFRTEPFLRRSLADMSAHGMNSFSVYADLSEKKPDGEVELKLDGGRPYHYPDRSCSLEWQMRLLKASGLSSRRHPLLLLADPTFTDNPTLMVPLASHGQSAGWPEFLLYLVDEPDTPEKAEQAKRLNNLAHGTRGIRTVTAIGEPGELGAYYDVWIVSESVASMEGVVAQARAAGKEAWAYNCQWNGARPANDRYFAGYFTWTAGLQGNWQWCYSEASGGRITPEGDMDFGDVTYYEDPHRTCYVLPGPDHTIPTLGWEGRREGIDDYRYLQALREAVRAAARHQRPEQQLLVREAERFLAEVQDRTRRPPQQYPATQTGRVYDHVVHPGLKPSDYDAIRARAADLTCRLAKNGGAQE